MSTLPREFEEMLASLGRPEYASLPEALISTEAATAVRLNPAKTAPDAFSGAEAVAWHPQGFTLPDRPAFTLDPALHQGRYYVQDASSMAIHAAIIAARGAIGAYGDSPLRYLDACAAPGGKTTAALAALPENSLMLANEFDPRRGSILKENVAKWGLPALISRGDASLIAPPEQFFDIIAADVPCSGEGMMRKNERAVEQWSPALVRQCAALQWSILENLWSRLRPGGALIYSTCTFNTLENEDIIARAIDSLGAEIIPIPALERPEIIPTSIPLRYDFPAYHFLPGRVEGEGQFIALLRKPGVPAPSRPLKAAKKIGRADAAPKRISLDLLEDDWTYRLFPSGTVWATPAAWDATLPALESSLHLSAPGILVGEMKGRDLVPAQPLAMAVALKRDAFPRAEIDRDTALAYLRREPVTLPDAPRGFVLLTWQDSSLGFVKNLGNRSNNLYPAEWRIQH